MTRIGFLGAFSIDNAGDAIVGYAGRQAVRERLPAAEQIVYAPDLPHALWQHEWSVARGIDAPIVPVPASSEMAWASDLDALVIGGGGIINLDPAFRPFLLGDPTRWPRTTPAAWNGVCSQNQPWYAAAHADTYATVRECCEALRYVAVRNRTTLSFVRHCGYRGEVHLVPDPALGLTLPAGVDERVTELLAMHRVPSGRTLVGVSIGPSASDPRNVPYYHQLLGTLATLGRDPTLDLQFVVFPFSQIQGDVPLIDIVASHLPGAIVIRERLDPLVAWRLIGRMNIYVGCRYHAILAAFAQNVAFLALDEYLSDAVASSKIRELVTDFGLEPHYLCPYFPGSPAAKVEGLVVMHRSVDFSQRLVAIRSQLAAHYDRMLAALALV